MSGPGAVVAAPAPATTWMRGGDVAKATCSIEGCTRPAAKRTWCATHYERWRLHGTTDLRPRAGPVAPRFWAKVNKTPTCWLWTAAVCSTGYARILVDRKFVAAHRWAYEELVGPIPDGLELDHLCRTPRCVNPAHLEPVTHQENMRRASPGPWSHCKRGHPLTTDNVYRTGEGGQTCRICALARVSARLGMSVRSEDDLRLVPRRRSKWQR